MKIIDCLGEICPIPIMMLEKEINSIKNGTTVMIITDHSCTLKTMKEYCIIHDFSCIDSEAISGVWEITITNTLSSV